MAVLKTLQSTGQDSHEKGWRRSLLLLDAEPKQADLPPRSPLSAGRKFGVVRRRRSHCVSSSISRCLSLHNACMESRTSEPMLGVGTTWQVSTMGISFSLKLRHVLLMGGADLALALITGSHFCNCTYKNVTQPDLAGVWVRLYILHFDTEHHINICFLLMHLCTSCMTAPVLQQPQVK